jgi:hypothetical protein
MGIVLVARRAGSTSVEEDAKMRSTFMRANSAAASVQLLDRARPSELDDQVLPFDVTEIAQARPKRLDAGRRGPVAGRAETHVSEAGTFRGLLRTGYQRPGE